MAELNDTQRRALWARFQRQNAEPLGALTKTDIRAAVDALDTFLSNNEATINAAIPQPARSALTTRQKAALLALVIAHRYEVL